MKIVLNKLIFFFYQTIFNVIKTETLRFGCHKVFTQLCLCEYFWLCLVCRWFNLHFVPWVLYFCFLLGFFLLFGLGRSGKGVHFWFRSWTTLLMLMSKIVFYFRPNDYKKRKAEPDKLQLKIMDVPILYGL